MCGKMIMSKMTANNWQNELWWLLKMMTRHMWPCVSEGDQKQSPITLNSNQKEGQNSQNQVLV